MSNTNLEMLLTVVKGLGELADDVVFVGGSVAELYASNVELSDIRPTLDVDCIIEVSSKLAYYKLEEKLHQKGFKNDTSEDAPICRWLYKGVKVDIMPVDEKIIGFSNIWYSEGIKNKISRTIQENIKIFIFRPEYYLASKLEAHKNRGSKDLRQSHDFEDIIYLLDNYPDIINDISNANDKIKRYIRLEFINFQNNRNLIEGIECALPYGADAEGTDIILKIIDEIISIPIKKKLSKK